ncbi:MAG: ankyrin repeat domain-containing protein [Pseudomonadota bacterium]
MLASAAYVSAAELEQTSSSFTSAAAAENVEDIANAEKLEKAKQNELFDAKALASEEGKLYAEFGLTLKGGENGRVYLKRVYPLPLAADIGGIIEGNEKLANAESLIETACTFALEYQLGACVHSYIQDLIFGLIEGHSTEEHLRNLNYLIHFKLGTIEAKADLSVADDSYRIYQSSEVIKGDALFHTALLQAPEEFAIEIAKLLIDNGADKNIKLDEGSTVLHIATSRLKHKLAEYFVSAEVDVKAINKDGLTYDKMPPIALKHSIDAALEEQTEIGEASAATSATDL